MNDEQALLFAITANADEDVPRLMYADWLDENGDHDRAAFIRVQCQLAGMSPAHAEWVDLCEQQLELNCALKHRLEALSPSLFPPLHFSAGALQDSFLTFFNRGFASVASCLPLTNVWQPEVVQTLIQSLTLAIQETQVRTLALSQITLRGMRDLLASPVMSQLRGFAFDLRTGRTEGERELAELYRELGENPRVAGLQFLQIGGRIPAASLAVLATATALRAVRELILPDLVAAPGTIATLTRSLLFSQLRKFTCELRNQSVYDSLLTGLARLPELHTLTLDCAHALPAFGFAQGEFPAVGRLSLAGRGIGQSCGVLASAKYPALAVFKAPNCGINNERLATLLRASWFPQVRMLEFHANGINPDGLRLLAQHPVAKTLRVLSIGNNPLRFEGLSILAREGAFPALTTLSLQTSVHHRVPAEELELCLTALRMPNLKYLNLQGWQLRNAGAMALAKNRSLANLKRLILSDCSIGDLGAEAIFQSPQLQNLIELRLDQNEIHHALALLSNPGVMPNLRECWLSQNHGSTDSTVDLSRPNLFLVI